MSPERGGDDKHILFLISALEGGGAERVASLLCNRWVSRGYRVTVMPTYWGRGRCAYPLDERVTVDFLADRVGERKPTLWNMARRFVALRRAIRELQPDVVVSFLARGNVTALLATRGLRVPVVVSERTHPGYMPLSLVWRWLRRLSYRWAQCVVAQTGQTAEWLAEHCPGVRVVVIENPIVLPLPEQPPCLDPVHWIEPGRRLLLAIGRLKPQKGFSDLLEAFSRLASEHRDWDLVILGEGWQRPVLEHQRQSLGLGSRVHLPGWAGNIEQWYRRADLYVLSSRFEGFPNTVLEAMAHGVPVVSTDCPAGPRDILHDGVDGLLVDPASGVAGLAHGLGALMSDDERRAEMGEAAGAVRERYSLERIDRQWDEVLGLGSPSPVGSGR